MPAAAYRHGDPIATINITPMIDVMLVLLVMLILTIPIKNHKVAIDLPGPARAPVPQADPHRLAIARDGSLGWDGRTVSDGQLRQLLSSAAGDPARPALHLQTDPEARFERFDQVLADVKRAGITRLAFIGDSAMTQAISSR